MIRRSLRHVITAVMLLVALACQGTWALAGTTGGLTGSVVDADSGAPVAGATVTANSPSQIASATTDASGRFALLTLAPDTYTVTVSKDGYQSQSAAGQVVFADSVQPLTVRLGKALKTIASVRTQGAGALVKSGTTADVYSINSATQTAAAALGGGGSLNSAYSAIATVPGAYVIPNQTGYYQTINIRGGDYDQVGYEFDGVPVNRSFDNYASSSASSLGNAEVQVYTGASPANSEGQGLSGYINQVIKTGSYPGYADADLGIGTPTFYHHVAVEAGGSTPDRTFSYYVGLSGSNQAYNYVNNQNGAQYDYLGEPLGLLTGQAAYAPGWSLYTGGTGDTLYPTGPINYGLFSTIYGRNVVANFHIAIPHKHDAGRDDIQLLYDNEALTNQFYNSGNDVASPQCTGANAVSGVACEQYINGGPVTYLNTYTWGCSGSVGGTFNATSLNALAGCVKPYAYPSGVNTSTNGVPNELGYGARDNSYNDTSVVKVQYTKNFGSNAYFRLYGYTFYSDWFLAGAYSTSFCDFFCPLAPDYELSSRARGLSAEFSDQINAQNLVTLQGSYDTASVVRDNNGFYAVDGNKAVVVNANAPYSGYCYAQTGGAAVNCNENTVALSPQYNTANNNTGLPSLANSKCSVPGKPNLGTACTYMVAENGLDGTYSGTTPNFYAASLTDQFRPSDKWLFNLGVRLDSYGFVGQDTTTPPLGGSADARAFWFAAYNLDNCINNQTGAVKAIGTGQGDLSGPIGSCPAGYHLATLINVPSQQYTYNIWQPRVSGTYTVNANDVLRFSYGRYAEAPNTAFEQYNTRQEDLADYLGSHFLAFGRNTPGYPIQPPTSINYDFSWEHHFKGTDLSFKVTPFLRQTQDQIQQFFLDPIEGFVSGLNVGSQRSEGVEFQVQKGDFSRDGLAALLSFAYTNSYIHYGSIAAGANGTTVLGGINTAIANYNAYTKGCATNPKNPNCGTTSTSTTAAPCYTLATSAASGVGVNTLSSGACPAGTIANPYWNSPVQSLINTGQAFPTYDTFPGSLGLAAQGYGSPYVSTLVLNYKHKKYAITPSFQFQGGGKYGVPLSEAGIDPTSCTAALAGTARYNASSCSAVVDIPDPYTNAFDPIGSFTQPNEFLVNMQLSYDVSPRIKLTGVVANIVNYCWGGTQAPWTSNNGNFCAYNNVSGTIYPVAPYGTPGAIVNPPGDGGSIIQPFRKYPYEANFGPALVSAENSSTKTPLQFYITANIKI